MPRILSFARVAQDPQQTSPLFFQTEFPPPRLQLPYPHQNSIFRSPTVQQLGIPRESNLQDSLDPVHLPRAQLQEPVGQFQPTGPRTAAFEREDPPPFRSLARCSRFDRNSSTSESNIPSSTVRACVSPSMVSSASTTERFSLGTGTGGGDFEEAARTHPPYPLRPSLPYRRDRSVRVLPVSPPPRVSNEPAHRRQYTLLGAPRPPLSRFPPQAE